MSAAGQQRRRRERELVGRRAETAAALLLRLKGFAILARRFSSPLGEIDLVVRRGQLLVFVEVKRWASAGDALGAVGFRQRERIARAAALFLQRRPQLAGLARRFDVVAVTPWRLPLHLPDAWRP